MDDKIKDGVVNIGLATIAFNQTVILQRFLNSVVAGFGEFGEENPHAHLDVWIFLNSKIKQVERIVNEFAMIQNSDGNNRISVSLKENRRNVGVAKTWNDAILQFINHDIRIISNDDVIFTVGDFPALVKGVALHQEAYVVKCSGFQTRTNKRLLNMGYSCFAVQDKAIKNLGMFDENFFPAYNEDIDYERRARLAGLKHFVVQETKLDHVGSASIKTSQKVMNLNGTAHGLNDRYWQRKWKSPKNNPGVGYKKPFNDDRFTLYIDPENREHPYPGYNRLDREAIIGLYDSIR